MNIDMSRYKVVNGTFYDVDTPEGVVQALERAREQRTRIGIVYRAESVPEFGRVGRTVGPVKSPILLHNARSLGGEIIPTRVIIEIRESDGGRVLYREGS